MNKAMYFLSGVIAGSLFMVLQITTNPTPPKLVNNSDVCPERFICYEPYGAPVEPEFVLQGALVKVNFRPEPYFDGVEATATYVADFKNNISFCVIDTQMPSRVLGDPIMDALGHELLHCLTGSFHPTK